MNVIEPRDLDRFREIVGDRLGLQFDDSRLRDVESALRDRVAASGSTTTSYLHDLERRSNEKAELRAIAESLTIGETYFFRYWDQCRAFAEAVLPACGARMRESSRDIRILSAGCSSGEEPYTLAMLAREHLDPSLAKRVTVHACDVNARALEKAKHARYSAWSLRETPKDLKARYFQGGDSKEQIVCDPVRAMVTFEERNLVETDPLFWQDAAFDVVFCRNVTMYLRPERARVLIGKFARSLVPNGYLFLGHAETLRGLSHEFHLRHTHETFYYQRRSAGEASVAEPSQPRPPDVHVEDVSWVETIRRAADRIEALSKPAAQTAVDAPPRESHCALDLAPAVEMLREERFDEALALVQSLPAGDSGNVDAELLRAVLLTNSGRLREAEDVCGHILRTDEMNSGAHYLAALCREHAGDLEAAVNHDEIATYLNETFVMPHVHLGILARRAGNHARARTELTSALTLLGREDAARILLFGGGFSREALGELCRAELRVCNGDQG